MTHVDRVYLYVFIKTKSTHLASMIACNGEYVLKLCHFYRSSKSNSNCWLFDTPLERYSEAHGSNIYIHTHYTYIE